MTMSTLAKENIFFYSKPLLVLDGAEVEVA